MRVGLFACFLLFSAVSHAETSSIATLMGYDDEPCVGCGIIDEEALGEIFVRSVPERRVTPQQSAEQPTAALLTNNGVLFWHSFPIGHPWASIDGFYTEPDMVATLTLQQPIALPKPVLVEPEQPDFVRPPEPVVAAEREVVDASLGTQLESEEAQAFVKALLKDIDLPDAWWLPKTTP